MQSADGGPQRPFFAESLDQTIWVAQIPVSSSHGSGRAGGERALRLPPSSFPARLTAAADGCFPGYYNNQPATARLGPLRMRPPPGAHNAPGCGRRRMSSPPAQRGLGDHSQQRENLDFFSPSFSPPPAPTGLNPRPELFRHAPQAGGFRGVGGVPLRTPGQWLPLIGSKGVHAPSPA